LRNNFEEIYKNYISYLNENIPDMGKTLTYWVDPLKSTKTRSIMLPFNHSIDGNIQYFTLELYIFVLDSNPANITIKQLNIMKQLCVIIHNSGAVEKGRIVDADYITPTPELQNIGMLRLEIKLTVDYIDDCD